MYWQNKKKFTCHKNLINVLQVLLYNVIVTDILNTVLKFIQNFLRNISIYFNSFLNKYFVWRLKVVWINLVTSVRAFRASLILFCRDFLESSAFNLVQKIKMFYTSKTLLICIHLWNYVTIAMCKYTNVCSSCNINSFLNIVKLENVLDN